MQKVALKTEFVFPKKYASTAICHTLLSFLWEQYFVNEARILASRGLGEKLKNDTKGLQATPA